MRKSMPNAPPPSAPSMNGAASDARQTALTADGEPSPVADRFDLPDLCAPLAVFGVVMACVLLAILLTLARQPGWRAFYGELGPIALLALWTGLGSAALLCRLRPRLRRLSVRDGSLVTLLLVMVTIALISEA